MSWSQKILEQFALVPLNPDEEDFYGPYNRLLYTLFPPDTDFTVTPRYLPTQSIRVVDPLVTYEVLLGDRPVFVLELKAPRLKYMSSRRNADEQMRSRLADLRGKCPIPTLHGVCAMGTRLCFYHVPSGNQTAAIHPPIIPDHPPYATDTMPADRWDCDILDAEGGARFRAVVDQVYQACAALEEQSVI